MNKCVAGVVGLALVAGSAQGVVWVGSAGSLSASAEFTAIGSDLIVRLTNTSTADVMVPADVLTAVFFDVGGAPLSLTRTSAVIGPGSVVHFGGTDPGGVVGGEFAYKAGLVGPGGTDYGISSAGFGLFGPGDRFPGTDLSPPPNVDGLNYGITSLGDNIATGNAAVTGGVPLIQNEVIFTLSGLPAGFDLNSISNVFFQYGTALVDEPGIPGFPSPGALALLGIGGLVATRRRR